ncbi:MAG TPA: iron ABC transporter permease [Casimicrobiaceae bacterium]
MSRLRMEIAGSRTGRRSLRAERPLRGLDPAWLVAGACVALVAYLALVPLGFLLWQSFRTPETAAAAARFTLDNYRTAYASAETARLFGNSLQFAAGTALVSFVAGTLLAWANERTNTPCKRLFFGLSLIPLIIPGVLFVVAWILLGSPRIGLVNLVLQRLFATDAVFVDVYSMWGMVLVDGLHHAPIAFLLMSAAFRATDPALEESALMSGASVLDVARRITLRLASPAIGATLLILFVRAVESFEVPALLGLPAGIPVFTSAIYRVIHRYPSDIGLASAYAVTLLLITSLAVWLQSRISARGERYATITGKGFRPRPIDLGRWRFATVALFVAYLAAVVGLPFLVLLWSSLHTYYAVPSLAGLATLTLDPYRFVLSQPSLARAASNSIALALGSATLVMAVTSVVCWIVVRTRLPGRALLDQLASLPIVFPGLVLGLAIMVFYLHVDIGVYGTLWILLIAYLTRFMPYGLRYATASMLQIHRELEESAAMSGASWWTAFRRIVLPLLKPGLVAGWIYVVIVSVRELSSSILLYSPGTEVISVTIWELWENGQHVELAALGVMLVLVLLALVMLAQASARAFGIREA